MAVDPAPMTAAVVAQGLSRRYGRVSAVEDVSFSIPANQIVGLLGHNGAGKSTVMKMIAGYLEPSAGELEINGRAVGSDAISLQRDLGYLPEHLPLYPEMLVVDYLDYIATLKGVASAERCGAIEAALNATDLKSRALQPIAQLSRGLRQRVGVAQAVLGQPRLLILDEPSNGLDPQQAAQMRELITRLARRATVILSTHIMSEVEAICDRVLAMNQGRLALDCTLEELRQTDALELRTDSGDELTSLLARLPQINQVILNAPGEFRLHLHPGTDADRAAGNVAQAVVQSGARVYSLQAYRPDLDSIYRTLVAGDND